jgi:hypothetical protein
MYVLPFELNTMAFDFSWFTSTFQEEQTFLLLGAVKNQITVGPGYLLDP